MHFLASLLLLQSLLCEFLLLWAPFSCMLAFCHAVASVVTVSGVAFNELAVSLLAKEISSGHPWK